MKVWGKFLRRYLRPLYRNCIVRRKNMLVRLISMSRNWLILISFKSDRWIWSRKFQPFSRLSFLHYCLSRSFCPTTSLLKLRIPTVTAIATVIVITTHTLPTFWTSSLIFTPTYKPGSPASSTPSLRTTASLPSISCLHHSSSQVSIVYSSGTPPTSSGSTSQPCLTIELVLRLEIGFRPLPGISSGKLISSQQTTD